MNSLFHSETDQLLAITTLLQTQAKNIAATIQNIHQALAVEEVKVLPLSAEIDQVILPQMQSLQRQLDSAASEWSELARRVQQVGPLLDELSQRLTTRVSASTQQTLEQSEKTMAHLLAQFKASAKPVSKNQEKEEHDTLAD